MRELPRVGQRECHLIIALGIGNFVGPLVFKTSDAPRYPSGFIVVFATACVAVLLIIAYRAICVWENKRRDESGTAEGFEHAYEDDFTDRTVPSSHLTVWARFETNLHFSYTEQTV